MRNMAITDDTVIKKVVSLLGRAAESGIRVYTEGGKLKISAPEGKNLDPDLIGLLKDHKNEIMEFLSIGAERARQNNGIQKIIPVVRKSGEKLPLSFAQRDLWFIHKMTGSTHFHIPVVLRLQGTLDPGLLESAFREIVNRHEVLRTTYHEGDHGEPYQCIMPEDAWKLAYAPSAVLTRDEALNDLIREEIRMPFDLSKDHMLRGRLLKLSDGDHLLILVTHHISSDGWSTSIFVNELMELYNSKREKRSPDLEPLQVQYSDYARWQRSFFTPDMLSEKLAYWRGKLDGVAPLGLPADFPRPAIRSFRGNSTGLTIPQDLTERLQQLSQQEGVTMFMLLLTAFKILLYRYSGQRDICVGSPAGNRTQEETIPLIGYFINPMALRSHVDGQVSFRELLSQVKATTLEAYNCQDVPFSEIVRCVEHGRDISRGPVFQVVFSFHNTPEIPAFRLGDVTLSIEPFEHGIAKEDLTFHLTEEAHGLTVSAEYCSDLFLPATIGRMMRHYEMLLRAAVADPSRKIAAMEMLTATEVMQLAAFSSTRVSYPGDKTIARLFEDQVRRTPDKPALVFEGKEITYNELNNRASVLSAYLKKRYEVGPDDMVGIMMARSEWMMIAVLGILKAGAAYVPIDVDYPAERKKYIISDTGIKVLVIEIHNMAEAMDLHVKFFPIDVQLPGGTEAGQPDASDTPAHSGDLAYVMYTSGSTGVPKGVLVQHRSIARLIFNPAFDFLGENTTMYQYAPLSFDASTFEIWGCLLKGGKLVVSSGGLKSLEAISSDLKEEKVNTLWLPAGLFHQAADHCPGLFEGLQYLLAGGDSIRPDSIQNVLSRYPGMTFINGYGPTESTTFAITNRVNSDREVSLTNNIIGRPIGNTMVYIANSAPLTQVPIGVMGEILIGGDGLARGYLNQPDLTNEKFITDPFAQPGMVYRTGDYGRWLPDGRIEFSGRHDHQVKVRGFRVELGEVEKALQQSPGVRECVVLAKEDSTGSKRLAGYIVLDAAYTKADVLEHLGSKLPDYMIPSIWVELDSFPLTPNGKIDKKALPNPEETLSAEGFYTAPQTQTEQALARIWEELLGMTKAGRHDNFFGCGGHSLLAVRLISDIRKTLSIEISIEDIFKNPILSGLSAFLESRSSAAALPPVTPRDRNLDVPLSFSQQRLWLIDQLQGSTHYHIPVVLHLKGVLSTEAVTSAFREIVRRHEVMRTVFDGENGEVFQRILPGDSWALRELSIEDESQWRLWLNEEIHQPFDLKHHHLLRVHLVKRGVDFHTLVIVLHHIVSDGWSSSILVREFEALYRSYLREGAAVMKPLEVQYADFSVWQRKHLSGDGLEERINWWQTYLQGVEPLNLPADFQRPLVHSKRGGHLSFPLNKAAIDKLESLSEITGGTLYMTLLAVFNVLLYRYTGQDDICIGCPVANRTPKETEPLIGFFVNTLALRNDLSGNPGFLALLGKVKANTLSAFSRQDAPFELVVERLVKNRDQSRNPLFQVVFLMQNTPEVPALEMPGLDISYEAVHTGRSKFDLTFAMINTGAGWQLEVEYYSDLFGEATVSRMVSHFQMLMQAVAENPAEHIDQLRMLGDAEAHQLIETFNNTRVPYPHDKSIVDLFSEQVKASPDAVAVRYEEVQMTFKQMDERSNQLARYLQRKGLKEEALVAVCMEPSIELIVGILGILKAGGAYIPLSQAFPADRIRYIIEDAGVRILLHAGLVANAVLDTPDLQSIKLDLNWQVISDESSKPVNAGIRPDSLAYAMYTSGTTGYPKGVLITHQNVVSLVKGETYARLNSSDVLLATSTPSFDPTTLEYWGMLLNGGQLIVCPMAKLLDAHLLKAEIVDRKCNKIWFTTSWFNELVETDITIFGGLKTIFVGGEKLSAHHVRKLLRHYPELAIVNGYGPTENTTFSLTYAIGSDVKDNIPLGRPLENRRAYVLRPGLQLCPIGVVGELWVSGAGIARGYMNQPQLTSERFMSDPFVKGARLYRTGDLARWLPDGTIEFHGRVDDQVKIRGYRIEPGEIESALKELAAVAQAVVLTRENGNGKKHLVAYIVPHGAFDARALQAALSSKLPAYMIPSQWMQLPSLPLTSNGKINKAALPDPESPDIDYIAPRSVAEQRMVELWRDLLQVDRVGITDNFFELGGDSLKIVKMFHALKKEYPEKLKVSDLFDYPTIGQLADHITDDGGRLATPRERARKLTL